MVASLILLNRQADHRIRFLNFRGGKIVLLVVFFKVDCEVFLQPRRPDRQ